MSDRQPLHPRDEIVRTMERIYHYRMTTTSGGNLSLREASGDIWVTPARVDKGSLRADDIVCVRADGSVEGRHPPSSEFPFHRAIYEARPDIRGIVHAHSTALVAFSICRIVPSTRLFHQARRVCGEVGFAPYALPGSAGVGAEHRRYVWQRISLRAAGEPRRGGRRRQLARRLPALRDAGVHGQNDHQGRHTRRTALLERRTVGIVTPGLYAAADRCRSGAERP